jgi:hypothetical protein
MRCTGQRYLLLESGTSCAPQCPVWAIFDRFSRLCLPVHVRLAPESVLEAERYDIMPSILLPRSWGQSTAASETQRPRRSRPAELCGLNDPESCCDALRSSPTNKGAIVPRIKASSGVFGFAIRDGMFHTAASRRPLSVFPSAHPSGDMRLGSFQRDLSAAFKRTANLMPTAPIST